MRLQLEFGNRSTIENKEYNIGKDIDNYITENKKRKQNCINNGIKYFEINEDYEREIADAYQWIEDEIGKIKE